MARCEYKDMREVKRQLVIVAIFVILMWMLTVCSANISSVSPKKLTVFEPLLLDNNLGSYHCCSLYQFEELEGFFDIRDLEEFCDVRVKINGKALDMPESRMPYFSSLRYPCKVEEASTRALALDRIPYTARGPPDVVNSAGYSRWDSYAQLWSQFGCKVQRSDCRSCNAVCCIINSPLFD
jgi:hypothetical protein